jgi:hypothetical protein
MSSTYILLVVSKRDVFTDSTDEGNVYNNSFTGNDNGICVAPHINPHMDEAFSAVRDQVETCMRKHELCYVADTPYLPTRVLDISQERNPVLVEPVGVRALYTALSYCWGSSEFIKTTEEKLNDHKRGIAWTSLPKVFQDAITVTQKLGIRYIWIDSLCIIQNSSEDWHSESNKMCDIYANSHVTLAATTASNPHEGFLQERRIYKISTLDLHGNPQDVFARPMSFHLGWTLYGDKKPPLQVKLRNDGFLS